MTAGVFQEPLRVTFSFGVIGGEGEGGAKSYTDPHAVKVWDESIVTRHRCRECRPSQSPATRPYFGRAQNGRYKIESDFEVSLKELLFMRT